MADQAILANLVEARAHDGSDFDVLTFVHVDESNELAAETRSYRDLWDNGQRLAAGLIQQGMNRGDRFALVMQNHPEFVDAMVASSVCATVFVPVDPRSRGEKLAYMLGFAECRGVVVADYALAQVLAVLPQLAAVEWLWVLATGALAELPDSPVPLRWIADLPHPGAPVTVAVKGPGEPMR